MNLINHVGNNFVLEKSCLCMKRHQRNIMSIQDMDAYLCVQQSESVPVLNSLCYDSNIVNIRWPISTNLLLHESLTPVQNENLLYGIWKPTAQNVCCTIQCLLHDSTSAVWSGMSVAQKFLDFSLPSHFVLNIMYWSPPGVKIPKLNL
jgi:hypothetical protein